MLWSDPENEPPEDLRKARCMLHRAGVLLAVAMLVVMAVVMLP
jgi:hypothetical protein